MPAPTDTALLTIEFDREDDGRWIAEVLELPGVMVYGNTKEEALAKAQALAFRVLADQIEQQLSTQTSVSFRFREQVA
ncbi:MAG TPA: type II toxin-antitoxin system HicB family antitoxin [Terriglobales bacterium]|jgi:predicted RNase H-like HicB family nuclease|nr:type II toxin-antitoxin system HicB family antitoxin [Terriglobales bacterium]